MWVNEHGVQVWRGDDFPEPDERELAQYRFSAIPVTERQHPTCGKPGTGRHGHNRRGEPTCALCVTAERLYGSWRRQTVPA